MSSPILRTLLLSASVLAGGARAQCFDWQSGFEPAGAGAEVRAQVVFDDGSGPALYVGGAFRTIGDVRANGVAKWDGTSWSPLGAGIAGAWELVESLCVHDDGTGAALYVGGSFTAAGGAPAAFVAKWDGTNWSPLGFGISDSTGDAEVRALASYDFGSGPRLFAGGEFDYAGTGPANGLAMWDGATWSVPGYSGVGFAGFNGVVHALCTYDSGSGARLYAGGNYAHINGVASPYLAAWNGTIWTAISGVSDQVRALTVHDDGSGDALYLAQWSTQRVRKWDGAVVSTVATSTDVGTQPVALASFDDGVNGARLFAGTLASSKLYAWDGSTWTTPISGAIDGGVRTLGTFDLGAGEELCVGGEFSRSGSTRVDFLARSNGATLTPLHAPTSVDGPVRALASFDTGSGDELIAGGGFRYAGASAAQGLAAFDGTSWSDCGVTLGGIGTEDALAFTKWNDGAGEALFVGGGFMTIDGQPFAHVARWDGAQFTPLDEGLKPALISRVYALEAFDLGSGERLFAGGNFGSVTGSGAGQAIARWNGSTWTSILTGPFGIEVRALVGFASPSGPRLVQGSAVAPGGSGGGSRLSQWNGSSWSELGSDANGDVHALATWDDGTGEKLFAAGSFLNVGGVSAARVARWDGSEWTALGSGMNGVVYALELFDDGQGPALYAGGEFTTAGGVAASNVARWDGSQWSALGAGVDGRVYAMTVHDDGSRPALFLGGEFRASGNVPANFIAKWSRACTCGPVVYCTSGTTSNGCAPSISSTGTASASAGSGFTISVANVEGQKQGHIFYGVNGAHSAPWGASSHFLCVKAPTQRTGTQDSGGTAGACNGSIALDWNTYVATHPTALGAPFSVGTNVWAQLYFRDPAGPKTTALSDALMFTTCP